MPKVKQRPITPLSWLVSTAAGIGLFCGICYLVWKFPFFTPIAITFALIASIVMNWRDQRRLNSLANQRTGESICGFARSFDYRSVDTWVIRAVYEQVQEYVGLGFPVRASDQLVEDLRIDPEDLELDLAAEVAERTGRTLAGAENNPYYGKVKTMQDLVLFFNAQPRGSGGRGGSS